MASHQSQPQRMSRVEPYTQGMSELSETYVLDQRWPKADRRSSRLDEYYRQMKEIILARQSAITGLLPASTAVNAHGDYTDAWVRDNVYSILAVWGLALAYRKFDDDQGRTYELEYSVIKLMRGLLMSMMKQAHKVERFKQTQHPMDALHAKYDTHTGDVVVGDDQWGHLQLDATSLYLLMLAQMTASGFAIIQTPDEVDFIQNLVYYIGRTYRTPDYGIWERGNKINHGNPELNVSSIGMAKAALEAMNGLNLFGIRGGSATVIQVLPDEVARSRITLKSLLPRESNSKEVDSALLSVIGFPAFAVEDEAIAEKTRQKILDLLAGKYGCKRFLRDGHQTVLEDPSRLHYEAEELKKFENLECEWPLFFTYLFLDGLFRGDLEQAKTYREKLHSLLVEQAGWKLLPELYYVPQDRIAAEQVNPHSQARVPNENIPLIWAQSLYLLGELLTEGFIALGDVDPLGRHLKLGNNPQPVVQIAFIAENESLQQELRTVGIETQTPQQIEPIQVLEAEALSRAYACLGRNAKLKLSGRPMRRLRSLTTASLYRFSGDIKVFLPSFLDQSQFYLTLDYHFLVDQLKSELAYIQRNWTELGRPTLTLLITENILSTGREALLELFQELKSGICNGVKVKLAQLQHLMQMANITRIDTLEDVEFTLADRSDLHRTIDYLQCEPTHCIPLNYALEFDLERETDIERLLEQLRHSTNLYEQIELLQTLCHLEDMVFDTGLGGAGKLVTVRHLLEEVYEKASQLRLWSIIRRAAGLAQKVDISLSDAVTNILVRQHQISVGKAYSDASVITRPLSHFELMYKIEEFCREDIRDRVLTQEIIIYLDILLMSEPKLLDGFLTLRVGYFILLITIELAREAHITQDEAYETLMTLSPFEIKERLRQVILSYKNLPQELLHQESLHLRRSPQAIEWIVQPDSNAAEEQPGDWHKKRELQGMINRLPVNFYPRVRTILKHCKGIIIGDKLERRNRLDSAPILSEMTAGEKNFALRVEHLLHKIGAPQYRQLNIEALMELAAIMEGNADFYLENYIVLDVLIGHAVRIAYLEQHPEHEMSYENYKSTAWHEFYDSSPLCCAQSIASALRYLTELADEEDEVEEKEVSKKRG
jgi:phosphorylase kinase alpha/beta subunit